MDEAVIVDEFTGRVMPGRRWSDGQHQAIEAKENLADPTRNPNACFDYLSELLPAVPPFSRHDGYR